MFFAEANDRVDGSGHLDAATLDAASPFSDDPHQRTLCRMAALGRCAAGAGAPRWRALGGGWISESEFERMAPGLPRHAVTERRYIYLRAELLDWHLRLTALSG
jgi:hypothetical protein